MSWTLSPEMRDRFDKIVARYPEGRSQSAVIPLLHLVQEASGGSLTEAQQRAVAEYLGIPMSKVHEVTTFYSMYSLKPRGRRHLLVCRTLPCALCGCAAVSAAVRERLGVAEGEVTPDGAFSWEEVECLNHCDLGPVLQVGEEVYGGLDAAKVSALIETWSKEER
jgi:NADH-quinone oxidoreductase subunit E